MDGRTNGRTDGPTKRGVESRSTRLKKLYNQDFFLERESTANHFLAYTAPAHHTRLSGKPSMSDFDFIHYVQPNYFCLRHELHEISLPAKN